MKAMSAIRHVRLSALRKARLHIGRASVPATEDFVIRSPFQPISSPKLRVGKVGTNTEKISVAPRGIGSPELWARDMPRVDTNKNLISSYVSNFIQAAVNPSLVTKSSEKQAYVEALALNEAVEELDIPRECLVMSALIGSNVVHPTNPEADDRLTRDYVEKGVKLALDELNIETLDHVVCQIPDDLVLRLENQKELMKRLQITCDVMETLCHDGKVQSYGFAMPSFDSSSRLTEIVETILTPLSEQFDHFSSLQLPVHVGSAIIPLPKVLQDFRHEREMLLIGDRPLEAMLSNGNPFHFSTYTSTPGEEVAQLLKSAFNLAIAVEKKYEDKIRSEKKHLSLPPVEDVAWAHILANQHDQFDNLQVWRYVRETQIYPRLDATLKEFNKHEETAELGFAYSMAMNQLLKCFTASVELIDADRAASIMSAWKLEKGLLPSNTPSIEEIAVMATLSSGMDIALLEEQLPASSSLPFTQKFSSHQLHQLASLARPYLNVEK
ncbi:NADP-dependent oxidoreductase domain [Plasmopara halstedii]|uniref:NADP-dependent oxidoreductase domain n=1 Tax=Plasmopara halstedii TaxID=4781 RepID=A0A0P1ACB4_PLAHL|nr:NADP-dependent oxidoreductase domain [Plasmopara halstedii]CEG38538.1 NADP-dependent oxidoreductase domain [Plasmopara halstedii]|eukprot:XP_024574907.1 NADP-dependent oxidoreductase domain [Plasmopara halstedii]